MGTERGNRVSINPMQAVTDIQRGIVEPGRLKMATITGEASFLFEDYPALTEHAQAFVDDVVAKVAEIRESLRQLAKESGNDEMLRRLDDDEGATVGD